VFVYEVKFLRVCKPGLRETGESGRLPLTKAAKSHAGPRKKLEDQTLVEIEKPGPCI